MVVNVRSSPFSSYTPQFDGETVCEALHRRGIQYVFLGDVLGGRPEDPSFYDKEGHVRYDRVAQSPGFQRGVEQLLHAMAAHRVAILCAEEDPTHCHRRLLVGRVLAQHGARVQHVRADGRVRSEEEVAAEEMSRRTKGQLSFFDTEDPEAWRSPKPVSPAQSPRDDSIPSACAEFAD